MRWINSNSKLTVSERAILGGLVVLYAWCGVLTSAAQAQTSERKYVPRHERIAASILKSRGDRIVSQPTVMIGPGDDFGIDGESLISQTLTPPVPPADVMIHAPAGTQSKAPTVLPYQSSSEFVYQGPDYGSEHVGSAVEFQGDSTDSMGSHVYEDSVGWYSSGGCDQCGGNGGGCQACMQDACGPVCWIDTLSTFGGTQGFKNPTNRGQDGSFGFHEGFNWGGPFFLSAWGVSTQLGAQIVHSNFNGAEFTTDHRTQYFVTGGFYKRSQFGLQGGAVFDYLKDEWYFNLDLGQVRGEISWGWPSGTSLGMQFATSVTESTRLSRLSNQADVTEDWRTHDWFTGFYRHRGPRQGEWRVFAGATTKSDGIIGTDFKVPLAGTFSLEQSFTYLIPDELTSAGAHREESWNISLNVVWYPGRAVNGINWWHRPLFDVADNGSMLARRQ